MARSDGKEHVSRNCHINDPNEYMRRLDSYAPSRPRANSNPRPKPRRQSRPQSYYESTISDNVSEIHSPPKAPRRFSRERRPYRDSTPSLTKKDRDSSPPRPPITPSEETPPPPRAYRDSTPSPRKVNRDRDLTPSPTKPYRDNDPSPPKSSRPKRPRYAESRPDSYTSTVSDSVASSDQSSEPRPLTFNALREYDEKRSQRHGKSRRSQNIFRDSGYGWWTRKRKIIIFTIIAIVLLLLIIIIAVVASRKSKYEYTPSDAHVTNQTSFKAGGATLSSPNITDDGIGKGLDQYTYYSGGPQNFPPSTRWVSFQDMWINNMHTLQNSCEWLDEGDNNSEEQIEDIFAAIHDRANTSLVDHRYIFAIILQESNGCVHVGQTTSSGGVNNPGLMQSHNGGVFSKSAPTLSIMAMVQDGTQGTEHGDGLVQNLNIYGDPYSAARGYNSGHIPKSGNLSEEAGATACYVSDVANRLTGWVNAEHGCHET